MRDDFSGAVKEELAKRAGSRCSNPTCRQPTAGPRVQSTGTVNLGVAAHITAAAMHGPRYDPTLTTKERKATSNGIWLCQTCQKLIDSDVIAYPESLLRDWKDIAEATALLELKGFTAVPDDRVLLEQIESQMQDLFSEMRNDLKENPFVREFILLRKCWAYIDDPENEVLIYYFDDHNYLRQKVQILENYHLIRRISYNNVERFLLLEKLANYLKS